MEKYAIIVAGGSGTRMGATLPKQFLLLNGKPVIWYTLNTFLNAYHDMHIILVLPMQYMNTGEALVQSTPDPGRIRIVAGGATRFHSVQNGLKEVPEEAVVFVHDGVRCLVRSSLIRRCYEMAVRNGNAIPAVKATDSMRLELPEGTRALDREKVRLVQTPQTFLGSIIKPAFEQTYRESFTDEASVAEQMGISIHLVEGEMTNIKITTPQDILVAGEILKSWGQDPVK